MFSCLRFSMLFEIPLFFWRGGYFTKGDYFRGEGYFRRSLVSAKKGGYYGHFQGAATRDFTVSIICKKNNRMYNFLKFIS